jgi:polyphenol oxidase
MELQRTSPPYYTSELLRVPHGMFTCADGTSSAPYASLNLSTNVGDQGERVEANRLRALAALGLRRLVAVHQVHGDRILIVDREFDREKELTGYDAMISTLPGTGLLIQQADCQAILLWAPQSAVIAAVHCGWRGSVSDIIAKAIQCLQEQFGVAAGSLLAAVSPSLGPCCAEFIHYRKELPAWMYEYQVRPHYFDFWAISRRQLLDAGVPAARIDVAALCTCCDQRFFSYRRATKNTKGITGRNGSIIGLPVPV